MRTPLGFALAICIAGCASTGRVPERDLELSVPSQLESVLASHRATLPVERDLVGIDSITTIDHKGNFRPFTEASRTAFEWQTNGHLFSTTSSSRDGASGADATGVVTSVSLCGLVPLLIESAGQSTSRGTAVIPAGGAFVPFGFSSNSKSAMRFRISSFSSTVPNVCSPEAGSSFSYETTGERQRMIETSVIFRSNLQRTESDSVQCSVSATEKPASEISADLRGGYLEVACLHKEPADSPRRSVYAFLRASGVYVPITVRFNEWQTNVSRYTTLRYK